MPREGVPYPERLLCSVRCELKNIWNALNGKLHSVNGVEGNGQGNVDIVSGDAAVVVTPQPLSNQVEISLDQSQLPAAAVTSVNNQTGAVTLDGTDIKTAVYGPNNTATQDIGTARTAIQSVGQNVTAEATARQNADSALQNNINACYASIPGEVSSALASSPRISAIEYNLTQAENDIDALENTRLKITDVNQYAVGLTGNQGPIAGVKTFEYVIHKEFVLKDNVTVDSGTWKRLYTMASSSSGSNRHVTIEIPNTRSLSRSILDIMWGGLSGSPSCQVAHFGGPIELRVCRATDGHIEVWTNDHVYSYVLFEGIRTAGIINVVTAALSPSNTTEPVVGADFTAVVTPTVIS